MWNHKHRVEQQGNHCQATKKKRQAVCLAEIFHAIAVNQAGLGLASKTAHASNLVTGERRKQDKAASLFL